MTSSTRDQNRLILDRERWKVIQATFASRNLRVSGKAREMLAKNIADSQPLLHERVANIVGNLAANSRDRNAAQSFAEEFKKHTSRVRQGVQLSITMDGDNGATVNAPFPVLSPESVDALNDAVIDTPARLKANPQFVDDAIGAVIVAYVQAFASVGTLFDFNTFGIMSVKLHRALIRSEIYSVDAEVEATATRATKILSAGQEELAEKYVLLERDAVLLENRIGEMTKEEENLSKRISDANKDVESLDGKTAAAYQTLIESIGLRETENLWKGEATRAKREYYASFIVLIFILLTIPLAIAIGHSAIFSVLSDIEASAVRLSENSQGLGATAVVLGRVLLLTIPLGFVIWAIKIGVRYNVRSMLLMDDATHRVTMLNTYLFLIKQNAATVQDRGAVLEALFRRTPGHGPETVEAPNLTDLMKYGTQMDKV